MRKITFEDQTLAFADNQSALEALEEKGFVIPSRCRKGNCHSCVLHCEEFDQQNANAISAPDNSVYGLDDKQTSTGLFLACQCKGSEINADQTLNMSLAKLNVHSASVIEKKSLNDRVFSIKMTCNFSWQAGQFINIHTKLGQRSYSIASTQDEGVIELHISKQPQGQVSNYLFENTKVGSKLTISNPNGDCVYHPAISNNALLLVGTGSGLAPLVGILKQAIKSKHQQNIHLYIAQGEPEFQYYQKVLNRLDKKHENVIINYVCRRNTNNIELENNIRVGELEDIIKADIDNLQNYAAFLCGSPQMVRNMQIQCSMSRMDRNNIRIDSFE